MAALLATRRMVQRAPALQWSYATTRRSDRRCLLATLARFVDSEGQSRWGKVETGKEVTRAGDLLDVVDVNFPLDAAPPSAPVWSDRDGEQAVCEKLLAPLPVWPPPAIIAIGLNYQKHAEETGNAAPRFPIILYHNPSSATHPGDPIIIPKCAQVPEEVDYEAELAIIIGKKCRDVTEEEALDHVFGYTVGNDVSARRWQGKRGGGQWARAKSFDTFNPMGPHVLLAAPEVDPGCLAIGSRLNGSAVQDSNTSDMIFSPAKLISFISQSTTLLPGTVILTGTPEGVGYTREPSLFLRDGDTITCSIEKVGELENPVANE